MQAVLLMIDGFIEYIRKYRLRFSMLLAQLLALLVWPDQRRRYIEQPADFFDTEVTRFQQLRFVGLDAEFVPASGLMPFKSVIHLPMFSASPNVSSRFWNSRNCSVFKSRWPSFKKNPPTFKPCLNASCALLLAVICAANTCRPMSMRGAPPTAIQREAA